MLIAAVGGPAVLPQATLREQGFKARSQTHAVATDETADADAWVVALADMPWIASRTIEKVAYALRAGASIAAPSLRGQRGPPVGFARRHRAALAALTGDLGARDIITRNAVELTLVDVDDPGIIETSTGRRI